MIGITVVIVMTMAGLRALLSWTECWNNNDEIVAAWIRQNTAVDAVFYYNPSPLNFVSVLTGRQTYCGVPDVVAAEGFDPGDRLAEVELWGADVKQPVQFVVVKDNEENNPLMALNRQTLTILQKRSSFMQSMISLAPLLFLQLVCAESCCTVRPG
jgi:hypothetical protein